MKKIASLFMALIMILSITAIPALAAETTPTNGEVSVVNDGVTTTEDVLQPMADTSRVLKEFQAEKIYVSKTYTVNPNKNWNLWLVLGPVGQYGCTITVKERTSSIFATYETVWSRTLSPGEKVNQMVVQGCNGRDYRVIIAPSSSNYPYCTIAGGIVQTEVATR